MVVRSFICGLLLLSCIDNCLQAVDNLRITDMRSMGMGGNGVTQSVQFNPALLPLSSHRSIHINYLNRYAVKELGTLSGSFQYPNAFLSTGVDISSFGYDDYRESMFRLSLAKSLGMRWTLGIAIQYAMLQTVLFEEHPSSLSTDIGATFRPVDKLLIGMLIMNAPSVRLFAKNIEVKDFSYYAVQIGFQWEVINSLLIAAEMVSDEEHPLAGSVGIEYTPFPSFRIRAGVQATPFSPTVGVGYSFSKLTTNVAAIYHPFLGVSMGLGLIFSF